MRRKVCAFLGALVLAIAASHANAVVVTFDDQNPGIFGEPLPDDYQGLIWNNFGAANATGIPSGYWAGQVSGHVVAYNRSGATAQILSPLAFTLNGFYMTAAWMDGLVVSIIGSYQGQVLYSTQLMPSATASNYYLLDWVGVDKIRFESIADAGVHPGYTDGSGRHFAIDNLSYNEALTVPEPFTLALSLMALGAAIAARRRTTTA
ncbi:hypothetical protein [Roseateles chitosanitabidus]|uniref:hypothetical protein n=1 Tax=Roseateles chitosanitabidus TaxID=65048 RepID=UPI0008348ADC|nr:hypothetical protein [Roseateles chitosanitabidus]